MSFKSAYLRLTVFYVLVVMLISIVFSVVLYEISSNELNNGLGRQERILRSLPANDQNIPITPQNFEQIRLDQLETSNRHIRAELIDFNVLILILSAIASYLFAKKTLRPIEEMVEAQNRFTADASHELKTPLTAMRTEIEVLLRNKKTNISETKNLLQSNLEEISKLESLSNALLKLAKHEDEANKNFATVNLEEIVTEAFEKIESLARKKNIKFSNEFENVSILGDRTSLVELFVILLDNAIKYSPAKSVVSIKIKKELKHAVIRISDHGIGIAEADLPHIFDRFYRVDDSRCKDLDCGYGLGLSIAKSIVEMHQGTISVQSELQKGSTFKIKFDLAEF